MNINDTQIKTEHIHATYAMLAHVSEVERFLKCPKPLSQLLWKKKRWLRLSYYIKAQQIRQALKKGGYYEMAT